MDQHLKHRINAGRVAVMNQVEFMHAQFARVESEWKYDNTRVTFADVAISEKIFAELRESFPDDDYCSEESNPNGEVMVLKSSFTWLLDPVDGTNNYAIGMPFCTISLALLRDGVPIYGFLYDMARRRLMEGGPNMPLLDSGERRQVVQTPMQAQSIVCIHFPLKEKYLKMVEPLLLEHRTRSLGSSAMALGYVAAGFCDGIADFRIKVWDIAAGHALMAAAGGEFHFLEREVFPMTEFHVDLPPNPYYAGSKAFCRKFEELL
jgi:myo-inositol-1(or 4)-monophosphatase